MTSTILKKFLEDQRQEKFDYGVNAILKKNLRIAFRHRLHGHLPPGSSEPELVHGHTVYVTISIIQEGTDFRENSWIPLEMVTVVCDEVTKSFEGKLLLFKDDPAVEEFKDDPNLIVMPFPPSRENLAFLIFTIVGNCTLTYTNVAGEKNNLYIIPHEVSVYEPGVGEVVITRARA